MAVCSATWLAITIAVFVGNHRRPTAVWEGYRDPIAWAVLLWPALGALHTRNCLRNFAAFPDKIKSKAIAVMRTCEYRIHRTHSYVVPPAEIWGLWGVPTGPFSTGEIAQLAAQARISATAGQVSYRRPCWAPSCSRWVQGLLAGHAGPLTLLYVDQVLAG